MAVLSTKTTTSARGVDHPRRRCLLYLSSAYVFKLMRILNPRPTEEKEFNLLESFPLFVQDRYELNGKGIEFLRIYRGKIERKGILNNRGLIDRCLF